MDTLPEAACRAELEYQWTADGDLLWRAPAKLNLTLQVLGRRGGRRDDEEDED